MTLFGRFTIFGRTCSVHVNQDDLGLGNTPDSLIKGNSGTSISCGVLGRVDPNTLGSLLV
jgi:Cu-Zn family superoxide dismutase